MFTGLHPFRFTSLCLYMFTYRFPCLHTDLHVQYTSLYFYRATFLCVYRFTFTSLYVYRFTCLYVYRFTCLHVFYRATFLCIYKFTCLHLYMFTGWHPYSFTCLQGCMFKCLHICIVTSLQVYMFTPLLQKRWCSCFQDFQSLGVDVQLCGHVGLYVEIFMSKFSSIVDPADWMQWGFI